MGVYLSESLLILWSVVTDWTVSPLWSFSVIHLNAGTLRSCLTVNAAGGRA